MSSPMDVAGTDPGALSLWVAAGLYGVPALVWAIVCQHTWWTVRTRRPQSRLYVLLPFVSGTLAAHYLLASLIALYPIDADASVAALDRLGVLRDLACIAAVMAFRHVLRHLSDREEPPSRTWLTLNDAPLAVVAIFGFAHTAGVSLAYQLLCEALLVVYLTAGTLHAWKISRGQAWGHAGLTAIRTADVAVLAAGFAGTSLLLHATAFGEPHRWTPSLGVVAANATIGVLLSIPFVIRLLGEVLRALLLAGALLIAAFTIFFAGRSAFEAIAPGATRVGDAVSLLAILVLLGPGQRHLRSGIDRLGFRRTRKRASRLHEVLHTLSPELGAVEWVRRALAEFARVMETRVAARAVAHA